MPTAQTAPQPKSQAQYRETPYQDQAWEIIGTIVEKPEFTPMPLEVLAGSKVTSDPMFSDFGGLEGAKSKKRTHVPIHEAQNAEMRQKEADRDAGMIKLAPQDFEEAKRKARDEGLKAGRALEQQEGAVRLQQMQKSLQLMLQDLAQQMSQHLRGIEAGAVDLALQLSSKLVGYAVEINPEYLGKLVHEALSHAGSSVVHRVRVSPQDMEFIEVVGISKQVLETDGSWKFESDESIKSGCIIDTSAGEIDFRLDQAFERTKESILKAVR